MKPLIVVVGETSSGKSSLAMEIARQHNGEIIGADSWTVYREFTIGTAKPSRQEMDEIPHHLFDVVDAEDGFNAALYKRMALEAIDEVHSKGKLPILVGGTGLYIDSVLFDYEFLPPGSVSDRERRNNLSLVALLNEAKVKNLSLANVDIRNKRRIIRALETNGKVPTSKAMRDNTLVLGIVVSKENLRERITARVESMLASGLETEVNDLVRKYGWDVEPMKGIGYREWREYFLGSASLEETRERIISSTMNLAKRQRTWFKRNSGIHWINNREESVATITTFLNKNT